VRFRLDGRVTTTRVQANDAGQAKKLVQAQYGDRVTVLSTKRVD
jgi:flagellar biosynthesis GTPase FlhF